MKNISAAIQAQIDSDNTEPFLLFSIGPNYRGDYLAYTTLPYEYTYDGIYYDCENRIISIDPPRISDTLDREAFKVSLHDSDTALRGPLNTWRMAGVNFKLLMGFSNGIGGAPLSDTLNVYEGTVDTYTYAVTPNDDSVLIIEGTSPVGALDMRRTVLTSRNYLQAKYPNDTSYDQVVEGSSKLLLLWGKE